MLLSPAYKIKAGDRLIDTTQKPGASTLVDLTVRLEMDAPSDSATMLLGNVGGLDPQREDAFEVELGYLNDGGLTRVLTGEVATVSRSFRHQRVIAHTGAARLLSHYLDRTFESMSAGDIVRELAEQAEVRTATIADGPTFPAYVIDGRRDLYRHLEDLAELCGFDCYFNSSGELMFEPFLSGKAVHVFKVGKHLIQLQIEEAPARAGTVETWGESPGSSQGDESWAWLTKDFASAHGKAGHGAPTLLLERPALRTAQAAAMAARGIARRLSASTLQGHLLTYGRPKVKLGDAIRIEDAQDSRLNGLMQVRAVEHRLTKTRGFTTRVEFRGTR